MFVLLFESYPQNNEKPRDKLNYYKYDLSTQKNVLICLQ
jgi:hypothetical protein